MEITEAIETLRDMVSPQIPLSVDLWDARHAAAYLKVKPRQITERYALRPGFPPAIRLPTKNGRGHPRWRAIDIIEWAEKHMDTRT